MNAVVQPLFAPIMDTMRAHVEHLFGGYLDGCHDGLIELAWTDTKPDAAGKHALKHARLFGTDQIEELVSEAVRLNLQPMCNVYIGAALRKPGTAPFARALDNDAYALTAAYVDLDDEGAATAAKDIYGKAKPTFIVVTGRAPHTRAQMWWRLDEPLTDPEQWPALLRGMAAAMRADSTVTNPSRVMRLAGSVAWPVKDGRKTEMTDIGKLIEPGQTVYAYGHMASMFPPVASSQATAAPTQISRTTNSLGLSDKINDGREAYMTRTIAACLVEYIGTTGCAPTPQELYEAAWPQYERHVDFSRAGRGPEEFAEKCAYTVNRFARGEIRGVESLDKAVEVYRGKAQARASSPRIEPPVARIGAVSGRFLFEKISDLRRLPPAQWLVKDWVPEGATGIFYGKWAAGKSFIGFDLALHLAYGMADWHGVPLPGTPIDVLIIAREGHQGFVNRVDAFKKFHGLADDDNHVTFMRGSVSFMRDEEFSGLCDAIRTGETPYKLILVDTVARVLPGVDMNEQQTVTLFMERIGVIGAITGASTIGVHHQNKSGGMMGSTFFEANADFVFEVKRDGEEDGPLKSGEIQCTKMKDGEDRCKRSISYKKMTLSIFPDGPTSLVVDDISSSKATGPTWPESEMCDRILAFINEEWCSGNPLSIAKNVSDGRYAPMVISNKFDVKVKIAEMMLRQWLNVRPQVLSVEIVDKKTKAKGLKVVGSIH
jgi:hypothetical protein